MYKTRSVTVVASTVHRLVMKSLEIMELDGIT